MSPQACFRDRAQAGRRLAEAVAVAAPENPVVVGMARGGVEVARPIADRLVCPFDVLVVRKLGVPWHRELGMGAVSEEGVVELNKSVLGSMRIADTEISQVQAKEEAEVLRRALVYRQGRPPVRLEGATALVVDDGLATGFTARAGIETARRRRAERVWLAVPVGAPETVAWLSTVADRVICLEQPSRLQAVGQWYADFAQTSDAEVIRLLG